jgi:sugar diacid utilization regulator/GAF domain-containing protein
MTIGALGDTVVDTGRHRAVIDAFAQVTTEAITSASLQDLLDLIGRKLCAVLGATRCSAFLRRSDGRFQGIAGHAAAGDITPAITKLVAGTSEDALTREAVARRAPVLAADAQRDPRPVRRAMRMWRVRAILAVPLVFDGEVIGMLYVDDEDGEHVWTDADVELAALFGRLAALFVRQAQLNTRLASQARQLARQKSVLEHMGDLHARLTRAVLEGADIPAVVALIGELAGKPVILFDAALEVRAWAAPAALGLDRPPGLPDHVRSLPAVRAAIDGLDVDRPSATIPPQLAAGLSRRHLLCVLVVEGRRCGYIDIVEMGGLLGPLDAKLAEHGATVLSLQVLSEQRQFEAEGQARDDFLADLLRGGRGARRLERRAQQFGVDVTRPHVLVRFAMPDHAPQLPASARRAAVVRAAAQVFGRDEPPAVSVPGAVILLLRLPGDAGAAALHRLHDGVVAVVEAARVPAGVRRAVVSGVCRGVADFPPAHREIRELDELAVAFGRADGMLCADELGALRLVVSSDRVADAVRFADQVLGPLRRADAAGGGDLVATLRAYLHSGAQVRATAQALDVHENTVRYRLGRIAETSGTDPRRFDALLSAQLAFQVLDLVGRGTGPAAAP